MTDEFQKALLMFPCGVDEVSILQWFKEHHAEARRALAFAAVVTGDLSEKQRPEGFKDLKPDDVKYAYQMGREIVNSNMTDAVFKAMIAQILKEVGDGV